MINKEQLRYVLSLEQPNVEEMQDIIEAAAEMLKVIEAYENGARMAYVYGNNAETAPDILGDIIKGK